MNPESTSSRSLVPVGTLHKRLVALFAACCFTAHGSVAAAADSLESRKDELLYYWGATFGEQVARSGEWSDQDLEQLYRGLRDAAQGKARNYPDEYPSLLNNYLVQRQRAQVVAETEAGRAYVQRMGAEPGAVVTASGLVFRELVAGTRPLPPNPASISVHYVGTLRDGRVFDSSRERGTPLETGLDRVIACWSEGIPMMKIGGRARLTCPANLAYGERGNLRIPGGAALTFEVELLSATE